MNAEEAALYSKLASASGVTTLLATATSIFNAFAPDGSAYPLIILQLQGGGDLNDSATRAREPVYLIKAISAVSMYQAGLVDDAVDVVLHNAALTVTGWTNYWCAREGDVRYAEVTPEKLHYYHSGGLYRLGNSK